MYRLRSILKQILLSGLTAVLIFGTPAVAFADAQTDIASTNGTSHPTGVSAKTYHHNDASGLWENDYYTWNPTTKETLAKIAPEYTYNLQTGVWDTSIWEYRPADSQYVLTAESVTTPPAGAITHGAQPAVVAAPTPVASAASANGVTALPDGSPAAAGSSSGASNTNTDVTLHGSIDSSAQSGNALLSGNTTAGDATSGSAGASATVINLLQSSSSLAGSGLAMFTTDIQGDVSGDILIDPASLMQPAGLSQADLNNLTINSQLSGAIQNDITLSALSGNTTISDNRDGGNTKTGTATAIANVLNLINSVVAANQSFLGVINIYGNYTGNILVPTDSLNALLGSNAPAAAQPTDTTIDTSSNQQITNNVDLAAVSGNATLSDNTHAGNATSGNALTKLTILNLTGHQVNAANSLLVFVNVLGTWVGVIMDAPAGATAAALTATATAAATSNLEAPGQQSSDLRATVTDDSTITNNITAHATSGDATASGNTRVGDATSGNATASANIFNLINSTFSLSHWFGVLFINVFGSWHGNFGTAQPPVATTQDSTSTGHAAATAPQIFRFVASSGSSPGLARVQPSSFTGDEAYEQFSSTVSDVLAAHDIAAPKATQRSTPQPGYNLASLPIILGLTGFTVVGTERIRAIRRKWSQSIR